MEISVARASSLFKENGHDLKGIFTLFYNSIYDFVLVVVPHSQSELNPSVVYDHDWVIEYVANALKDFVPDVKKAENRIAQFNQEYAELKELSSKIKEVSFWSLLTRSNKRINVYIRRKREIEDETISLDELLNVAYYKFLQVNGTVRQFKEGFERLLRSK